MKQTAPTSLRRPADRYAATRVADALLRNDALRRRQMAANDELGGGTAPTPVKTTKLEDGPFAALRNHPQYRASRNGAFRRP
jgi:hypothetical protein